MLAARTCYLAGPIENCTHEEMWDWRIEATGLLTPMHVFNPCVRHFNWGPDLHDNRSGIAKEVVTLDKAEIAASDCLLVNYVQPAIGSKMTGTTMEIIYAFERGKLVVVVTNEENVSAWVEYHCHRIFNKIPQATEFIQNFYK